MSNAPRHLNIELDGTDTFLVVDGKRIAKRQQHAKEWIILQPGYVVTNSTGGLAIDVEYDGSAAETGGGAPLA